MKAILVSGFLALVLGSVSVGCASSDDAGVAEGEAAVVTGAPITLALSIAESKILFDSHVESFAVKSATLDLPCRDRAFGLTSKPSLYSGWSPKAAASFDESVSGSRYRDYTMAACRDASTEVLGWFGKERSVELNVSDQLLDKDYKPKKLPLLLQLKTIGASGAPSYFSCDSSFTKTQVKETPNAKYYDIGLSCTPSAAPTKSELGPIDFITDPGPYASVASYGAWMLPSVPANKASFDHVRDQLLKMVPEGSYSGSMSTLTKLCDLKIDKTSSGLVVDHTIQNGSRTRHMDLKPEDLLGYSEGDIYADPIRITGSPVGKFAAAEFRDSKGGSFVVRFEKNTSLDGQIVRINGSEAYCRRLK